MSPHGAPRRPDRRQIDSDEEIAMMRKVMAALRTSDAGMTTAEYAVGTVAACGFGALLYKILTSGFASGLLEGLISRALHVAL